MTLFDLLAESTAKNPAAQALSYRDKTYTYGELLAAAEGFAGGLASLGLGKGDRVALMLPNCPPFFIAYLAASRIGVTVVPMNVLYRPDEARYIMADSEVKALVTAEPFRPLVEALREHLPKLKHIVMVTEGALQSGETDFRGLCRHGSPKRLAVGAQDIAVVLYTSGTTGRPKGAMLTHRNLIANVNSCSKVLHLGPDDVFLSALPLFHAFAAMAFLLLPVRVGACSHLMERFVPAHTLNMLADSGATVFGGVPSMYSLMLQTSTEVNLDYSKLRLCISGGAPLPPEVMLAFEQTFGLVMVEGYGLTEASPVVSVNPPDGIRKPGSIGPVIPGVQAKIIDNQGREVSNGEVGELVIRGDNVMKGYLNKPEDTKQVLRNGWLYTGDLARLDEDRYLYIVGRKKELVIVGGLNVYPGEVERVLLEHPAVVETAAFGVSDPSRGEAVWAAVVLHEGRLVSEKELQAHCREKLASYKVPRGIEFVSELPKNALGKVMRHLLTNEVGRKLAQAEPVKH